MTYAGEGGADKVREAGKGRTEKGAHRQRGEQGEWARANWRGGKKRGRGGRKERGVMWEREERPACEKRKKGVRGGGKGSERGKK